MKTISIAIFLISGFVPLTFLVPERMNLIGYAFICIFILIFGTTIDLALQRMRGTAASRSPEATPLEVSIRQAVSETNKPDAKSQTRIYRRPRELGDLLAKKLSMPDNIYPLFPDGFDDSGASVKHSSNVGATV